MEATKMSSSEERKRKMWIIYTMEYYSAIQKNEIVSITATWIDLAIVILYEVSQTKKTNIICYHLYVEPKKGTNILICKPEIES